MSEPVCRNEYIRAESRLQREVFGEERLQADAGHYATGQTTRELANMVIMLCTEVCELGISSGTLLKRQLDRGPGEDTLAIQTNLYGHHLSEWDAVCNAEAVVFDTVNEVSGRRGRGDVEVRESVYVSGADKRAYVQRSIATTSLFGKTR